MEYSHWNVSANPKFASDHRTYPVEGNFKSEGLHETPFGLLLKRIYQMFLTWQYLSRAARKFFGFRRH
jgi:hypothetical protein